MSGHDDVIKEWALLLFQWTKEWYEKSQLDQWVQFLLDRLRQFWSWTAPPFCENRFLDGGGST